MTQLVSPNDFLQKFKTRSTSVDALSKLRQKAWERACEIGMPGLKSEAFQYMRLRPLFNATFIAPEPHTISKESFTNEIVVEAKKSHIVLVDGVFVPELSDYSGLSKQVVILPLQDAFKSFGPLLTNAFNSILKEEKDPFAVLNAACHRDGLFIYVPPKLKVEMPIQILHLITTPRAEMMPRLEIFIGKGAKVDMVSSLHWLLDESANYLYNAVTSITVDDNAHLHFVQQGLSNSQSCSGWVFDDVRAILKRASHLKIVQTSNGRAHVRRDVKVELQGEGGEAYLTGTSLLDHEKESHSNVVVTHAAPFCHSMQLFKNVLTDRSKSSFQGKIFVKQEAQKTEAYQLNNNLILSDTAEAFSKPNLEIFADDVKASHGATVGQLREEEKFYLKTRGFSDRDATRVLIAGFCQEVINHIQIESLRKTCEEHIHRYVS